MGGRRNTGVIKRRCCGKEPKDSVADARTNPLSGGDEVLGEIKVAPGTGRRHLRGRKASCSCFCVASWLMRLWLVELKVDEVEVLTRFSRGDWRRILLDGVRWCWKKKSREASLVEVLLTGSASDVD